MRHLLHLSDVHFGPRLLPEVADGVLDLIARRRPDLVVISGDLTQRAKPRQFRAARRFVDQIEAMGVGCLAVPGNHDVPMYRALFLERLFDPFGAYRRHFREELEPVFEDEEMLLLGLNTAHNWTVKDGRLSRARLRRAAQALEAARRGIFRIVVAHHPIIPPPRFDTQRVLRNAYEAADLFSRAGVDLVLSGHLHQAYIGTTEAYYPSGRHPVVLLHSGTSTSSRGRGSEKGRNTCNWIELDGDTMSLSHLLWQPVEGRPAEGRFVVVSRHHYPRRHKEPYGLEVL